MQARDKIVPRRKQWTIATTGNLSPVNSHDALSRTFAPLSQWRDDFADWHLELAGMLTLPFRLSQSFFCSVEAKTIVNLCYFEHKRNLTRMELTGREPVGGCVNG